MLQQAGAGGAAAGAGALSGDALCLLLDGWAWRLFSSPGALQRQKHSPHGIPVGLWFANILLSSMQKPLELVTLV